MVRTIRKRRLATGQIAEGTPVANERRRDILADPAVEELDPSATDDPFTTFTEWASEADDKADASL